MRHSVSMSYVAYHQVSVHISACVAVVNTSSQFLPRSEFAYDLIQHILQYIGHMKITPGKVLRVFINSDVITKQT